MAKRAPSLSYRLSRSRRALAAFLLLGGSAIVGIAPPAAAHDHANDCIDACEASTGLPGQATDRAGWADDWMFDDYWAYEDCFAETCAKTTCAEAKETSRPSPSSDSGDGPTEQVDRPCNQPQACPARGKPGDAAGPMVKYPQIQDLVAWGTRAQQWISPLLSPDAFTPLSREKPPAVPLANAPSSDRDLFDTTSEGLVNLEAGMRQDESPVKHGGRSVEAAIACSEPITEDAPVTTIELTLADESTAPADSPATEPPKFGPAGLIGSSAVIATLPDAYLSYDLSPEDAIAMRMYPIGYPQSSYLGARRTGAYGPIDGLREVQRWQQVTEPAVTIATAPVNPDAAPADDPKAASDAQQEADEWLAALAGGVIEAISPDSDLRRWLLPQQIAGRLGQWTGDGSRATDPADPGAPVVAQAELQAPRRAAQETASPVAPTDQGRVLQLELACQTAIDVVRAQAVRAQRSGRPAPAAPVPANDIARAAAVATACDQAATSLEKLAMALRRAGDSIVRQAQSNASGQSIIR